MVNEKSFQLTILIICHYAHQNLHTLQAHNGSLDKILLNCFSLDFFRLIFLLAFGAFDLLGLVTQEPIEIVMHTNEALKVRNEIRHSDTALYASFYASSIMKHAS